MAGWVALLSSCIKWSPFDVDLDESQTDQVAKNVARLDAEPTPSGPFKIAFLTDTHDRLLEFKAILSAINALNDISVVFHGGDFTDEGTQQEYIWALELLQDLNAPFFVTPGNHDLLSNGPDVFQRMFGPDSYSFSWAGHKFVFFDTNSTELGRDHVDFAWLTKQLESRNGEPVVVITHHPPNSPPQLPAGDSVKYMQIQRDGGVVLNLHGHVHEGTRLYTDGPVTYLKAATAMESQFYVITVDGTNLSFEYCVIDRPCEPVTLTPTTDAGT